MQGYLLDTYIILWLLNNLQNLPFHHRDHFDRMLISQVMANNLAFISADNFCHQYDLEVIW